MTASPFAGLELSGRVAVVTGAAQGIGAATADLLEDRGAEVWRFDRDYPVTSGRRFRGDVAVEADCLAFARHVRDEHPVVDILVNNAGVGAFGMSISNASTADWDRVMGVNARSVFMMSRGFLDALRASRGGVIVNVSSVHAIATSAGVAPYAASKGAVLALSRSMAIDLGPEGIRVVCVLPGATDTRMLRAHAERENASYEELGFSLAHDSFPRVCTPQEVAETVAFAASPAGSAIAGSAVIADGGLLAGF